ncbi:MAG TPA: mismatch-specific DNA-glycosylase [Azospirillaceae bacterium]|nr:mismatch-specific DNA-glycosylase [Azospirillaceae bacterium]
MMPAGAAPDPAPGPLADVLGPGMVILIVGFNPGMRSAETGHHYAGRGNQFWRLMAAAGLTPRLFAPHEDTLCAEIGLGLTNLVARATPGTADLDPAELRAGAPRIGQLVRHHRPRFVAYAGKGVYVGAGGRSDAPWGEQSEGLFEGAVDFVLPSPSGLARLPFAEKLKHYRALAEARARLGI